MTEKYFKDANDNDQDEDQIQSMQFVTDDSNVFILLMYWVSEAYVKSYIQMENWDGIILDMLGSGT